jgi:hypothetical protein
VRRNYQAKVKELAAKMGWKNSELGGVEISYFGEGYQYKYADVYAASPRLRRILSDAIRVYGNTRPVPRPKDELWK